MQAYISEQWEDFIALPAEVLTKIQAIWANSATGSRVRVRLKMLIAMWRKRPVNKKALRPTRRPLDSGDSPR
jgi:hypothetical protein